MKKLFAAAFAMVAIAIGAAVIGWQPEAAHAGSSVGCPSSWPDAHNGASGWEHTDSNGIAWVIFGDYPIYRAYLATNQYEIGYFDEVIERTCLWNIAKGELVTMPGGATDYFFYLKPASYGPACPSNWPDALNRRDHSVDDLHHTDQDGDAWVLFGAYPIYRAYLASGEHDVGYINEGAGDTCFYNLQRNKQVIMPGGDGHSHVVINLNVAAGQPLNDPTRQDPDRSGSQQQIREPEVVEQREQEVVINRQPQNQNQGASDCPTRTVYVWNPDTLKIDKPVTTDCNYIVVDGRLSFANPADRQRTAGGWQSPEGKREQDEDAAMGCNFSHPDRQG